MMADTVSCELFSRLSSVPASHHGDTNLGWRHRLNHWYAYAHQRQDCFHEYNGPGVRLEAGSQKVDSLHRVRILLLTVAFLALTWALVA
jgi:hypothetical protein